MWTIADIGASNPNVRFKGQVKVTVSLESCASTSDQSRSPIGDECQAEG